MFGGSFELFEFVHVLVFTYIYEVHKYFSLYWEVILS